ncbi:universal stress protein [Streptomyces sp. bgisy032]|uniref:universal stress protein n=1 Tax=Streptomyces sp. bgisy032 TaxID=3413773 RepID=UPI003D750886
MSPGTALSTLPAPTPETIGAPALPHPVTAVMTNRPDDVAVVAAAVRLAAPHQTPVLLVAVLPAEPQGPERYRADAGTARVFLARALPLLRGAGVGYIPVAHRLPAGSAGEPGLRAAGGVLALAARHHSPLVVASGGGPAGLDARSLIAASALRDAPPVRVVTATRSADPAAGAEAWPDALPPARLSTMRAAAPRRPAAAARPLKEA